MTVTARLVFFVLCLWALSGSVRALAKQKALKKRKGTAATNRGFGTKPLTFDQVVAKFPTRKPKNAMDMPCPCRKGTPESSILYRDCCAPYHDGKKLPESPERVLRSRYAAFCWRLIDYILETTHPKCSDYNPNKIAWAKSMNKEGMFDSFEFAGLEIPGETVYSENDPNEAFLKFRVRLQSTSGQLEGTLVTETSRFVKEETVTEMVDGQETTRKVSWLYRQAADLKSIPTPKS